MIGRILPDWDRNDKFSFLNSVYRLTYYSHTQCVALIWFTAPFVILPPFVQARSEANQAAGYIIALMLLFLATGLLSKFFEGYFYEIVTDRFKEMPHIRRADLKTNLIQLPIGICVIIFMGFGIPFDPLINLTMSTDPLLQSSRPYTNFGDFGRAIIATMYYSALFLFALASIFRGMSVTYYKYRLR